MNPLSLVQRILHATWGLPLLAPLLLLGAPGCGRDRPTGEEFGPAVNEDRPNQIIGYDPTGFPVYGVDENGQPIYKKDKLKR